MKMLKRVEYQIQSLTLYVFIMQVYLMVGDSKIYWSAISTRMIIGWIFIQVYGAFKFSLIVQTMALFAARFLWLDSRATGSYSHKQS